MESERIRKTDHRLEGSCLIGCYNLRCIGTRRFTRNEEKESKRWKREKKSLVKAWPLAARTWEVIMHLVHGFVYRCRGGCIVGWMQVGAAEQVCCYVCVCVGGFPLSTRRDGRDSEIGTEGIEQVCVRERSRWDGEDKESFGEKEKEKGRRSKASAWLCTVPMCMSNHWLSHSTLYPILSPFL